MRRVLVAGCWLCFLLVTCCAANAADYLADSVPCCEADNACGCLSDLPECCDCIDDCRRILGFLPSDHCFDSFISPLSNPFYFEDPRSLTEVRGIFIDNSLPTDIGGGDVHLWGVQLRGRLTENVSVIVPRLSYWKVNQGGGGAPEGLLPVPIGFKANLIRDVERQLIISGGITYFIPGNSRSLPFDDDGDFHFFLTGGKQIFDRGHWLSGTGFRIPLDNNSGTQMWYWSNQWDYEVGGNLYPLFGLNWYQWLRSSNTGFTGDIAGLDIINLPAAGVAGQGVVTGVVGLKWKPSSHLEVGGGYEFPITSNADILDNRAYADVIFRY